MRDHSPQVSRSVHLLLLLLLLLSVPLVSVQSSRHPHSGQNPYHEYAARFYGYEDWRSRQATVEAEEVLQYCDGDFDVYFVFDKSSAVADWAGIFTAWEDMVEKYVNPNLRMSFILFDDKVTVKMPLTADRKEIRNELTSAETVLIHGLTYLDEALEKVNEQIQMANAGATTRSSLIIIVVWGKMSPRVVKASKKEADRARSMGAYVYCVGMDFYDRNKLNGIADNEDKVFIVEGPAMMFHELVDTIGTLTCLELRSIEPSSLCTEEDDPLILKGYGFHNAKELSEVICRFKFGDSKVIDKSPTDKNFTVIICPRPEIEQPGQTFSVEVSLNNGRDFLTHTIPVKTSDCRPPPLTTTVVPETTTLPTTTPITSPTTSTPETTIPTTTPVPTTTPPPPLPPQLPPPPLPPPPPPPPPLPLPPPPTLPPPLAIAPPPAEPSKQVLLSTMVLALLLIPVLLWWSWWLCCRQPPKAQPSPVPQPKPRKQKEAPPPVSPPAPPPPVNVPPTVIICCCACCNVCVRRGIEGNVAVCNFNPLSCHQLPLMWSRSSDQGNSGSSVMLAPKEELKFM